MNANGITIDRNYPTGIDYNTEKEELIIATKTDIRCIDAVTGHTKRILSIEESEIMKCQIYFDNKQVVICKNNGDINLHSIENGELTKNLIGHSKAVSDLCLDSVNKIIVSGGGDSRLLFQNEKENNYLLRMQDKAHLKYDITLVTASPNVVGM